jgi:hypothetical protein
MISPREPTASKRRTLFCFGDGPVLRGELMVHEASSVATTPLANVNVARPQSYTSISLCTRLAILACTFATGLPVR